MITDVSTAIHMYRVSWNVKVGERVLEHQSMALQDVPIILRDTITSLLPVDCGEFEGTMDESVKVCDVEPLPEGAKLVPCSIVIRSIGRVDWVSICGQIRTSQVLLSMVLKSILLIHGIVTPVGRMADIEVE
jgi:hypothetical protein